MITLSYTVAGQLIEPASVPQYLVADTVGVYQVAFTFDTDWADMGEKTVVFRNPQVIDPDYRDVPVEFPLDANGQALVPAALLDPGKLFIGVYGTNSTQQLPTIWAPPLQVVPGASPGVEPSDDPALGSVIRTIPQTLTEAEQAQARENIGAIGGVEGDAGNVVVIGSNNNISDSGISKDNLLIAPQLASNNIKTDAVPYVYRQTGGGIGTGNREYDSIVGGSIVYKQMLDGRTTAITTNDITVTPNADGSVTVSGTASANTSINFDISTLKFEANHVYYCQAKGVAYTYYCQVSGSSGGGIYGVALTESSILKATQTKSEHYRLYVYNEQAVNFTFTPLVLDLTAMFGSAVADRIFTLYGGANTGTAEPFMASLGLTTYRSYTATPSLESVSGLQSHKTVGFNLFDGECESGYYDITTGEPVDYASRYRNKNKIPVLPNTTYYFKNSASGITNNVKPRVYYYDSGENYIGNYRGSAASYEFTTPSNCAYLCFFCDQTLSTYNNDICINLSWSGTRNGAYEPYTEYTYPLDSSLTLRGVAVIDDNNNIKFDGDEYAPDGTVTRRYGIVDLGTLTWTKYGTEPNFKFYSPLPLSRDYANTNLAIAICTKYPPIEFSIFANNDKHFSIGRNGTRAVSIFDSDLSSLDANGFKSAMSGVYLVYQLATPTTETAEPYESLQICDPLGTEEYVTTGICPVGHSTRYPENQVAKLDGLPSNFSTLIAPTEVTYKATRAYTTGRLLIVNNILYKATTSIASGATLTVGTNIVATTLDEVIASL